MRRVKSKKQIPVFYEALENTTGAANNMDHYRKDYKSGSRIIGLRMNTKGE
jgi:hypothetical protein